MTAVTLAPVVGVRTAPKSRGLAQRFVDVAVLTGRNLVHIARNLYSSQT